MMAARTGPESGTLCSLGAQNVIACVLRDPMSVGLATFEGEWADAMPAKEGGL